MGKSGGGGGAEGIVEAVMYMIWHLERLNSITHWESNA